MGNLELLSLEDQREINGGMYIAPVWIIEGAIVIEKAFDAFVAGFKAGSKEV